MSEEKQAQFQDIVKPVNPVRPGAAENARYQELEKLHDKNVQTLKSMIDSNESEKDKKEFIELQIMPVEQEMTELVTTNRNKGGIINTRGQQIKFTSDIKVVGLKGGRPIKLNYFKNTQLKKLGLSPRKVAASFKSQPVTIDEKESVSVALGPQFKDPITGVAVNQDNVAVDKISAGQVAPVNSSLAVNADMPNNRPEAPIADNVADMPAQANAVQLNDAGLLNPDAVEQVEQDVKVPAPQTQTIMGGIISTFSSPPGHHYTGAGTPVVDNIYNKKKIPINALDMISMIHDIGYQTARSIQDIKTADNNMISDINKIIKDRSPGASLRIQLETAKKAIQGKKLLEGPGAGITPVDFEANEKYLADNPEISVALTGILSQFNELMNSDVDITKEDNRRRFIDSINMNRPVEVIKGLERDKPALEATFREVPSLDKGLESKFEEPSEEFFDVSEEKELVDAPESQFEEFKRFMDNKQRIDVNERDYQDFLRNKQIKEQRIEELNKRERGLPRWLRPEFQKIYDQLDQLAYYSSPEFTEQENQLRYDQDRIRRGQSEQTDMSEQGLNIANNLAEREMKLRYNLPLDKPLWSAPTRGGLSVIPQDNYRVGYSRPYNREGESSFIQNTRNGVGLYNSTFPQPINNLRRNYSMPPMRAQVHQMPRNPIDREQFRHVRMMDRTPRGTATVLNDDFDGLNYKDDRRNDFERGMSIGERLQFEMFHMNN